MMAIKPIFKDLSSPELTKRCLGGKTQNTNESYNSVLWKYCPKTFGSGRETAEIAAYIAAVTFNDGNKAFLNIMKELSLKTSKTSVEAFYEKDTIRVKTSEMRCMASTYEARKERKRRKLMLEETQREVEGDMYEAGAF